jgi:hypothetical protein
MESSSRQLLGCAALLWAGWIIACANNSGSAPAAAPAPAPDEYSARCTAQPNESDCARSLLRTLGRGEIDLGAFNPRADALGEPGVVAKIIAAECVAQPAGATRLRCIEDRERRLTSTNWDVHAQPKP